MVKSLVLSNFIDQIAVLRAYYRSSLKYKNTQGWVYEIRNNYLNFVNKSMSFTSL
jgi:hypothetical protein